jgi:hypothetical protein
MIKTLWRIKDEASYWALRAYTRVLKAIGNASELATYCNGDKRR